MSFFGIGEGTVHRIGSANKMDQYNWYAAYTYPRHEAKVLDQFIRRDIESFLPRYRALHRWRNGCKVEVQSPLFPGYVFVRIQLQQLLRVLQVPSVANLVSFGGVPAPLPEEVVATLRTALATIHAEPHPFLKNGDRVRIRTGCLAGIEGILLRRASGYRLVLNVELVMQAVSIEVNAEDVEPISTMHATVAIAGPGVRCS